MSQSQLCTFVAVFIQPLLAQVSFDPVFAEVAVRLKVVSLEFGATTRSEKPNKNLTVNVS